MKRLFIAMAVGAAALLGSAANAADKTVKSKAATDVTQRSTDFSSQHRHHHGHRHHGHRHHGHRHYGHHHHGYRHYGYRHHRPYYGNSYGYAPRPYYRGYGYGGPSVSFGFGGGGYRGW